MSVAIVCAFSIFFSTSAHSVSLRGLESATTAGSLWTDATQNVIYHKADGAIDPSDPVHTEHFSITTRQIVLDEDRDILYFTDLTAGTISEYHSEGVFRPPVVLYSGVRPRGIAHDPDNRWLFWLEDDGDGEDGEVFLMKAFLDLPENRPHAVRIPEGCKNPMDVAYYAADVATESTLWIACEDKLVLVSYHQKTGTRDEDYSEYFEEITVEGVSHPTAVAVTKDHVYTADKHSGKFVEMEVEADQANDRVTRIIATADPDLVHASALAIDLSAADPVLMCASTLATCSSMECHGIYRINVSTSEEEDAPSPWIMRSDAVATHDAFFAPCGIDVSSTGKAYSTDAISGWIWSWDGDATSISDIEPWMTSGRTAARGIAISIMEDGEPFALLADWGKSEIRRAKYDSASHGWIDSELVLSLDSGPWTVSMSDMIDGSQVIVWTEPALDNVFSYSYPLPESGSPASWKIPNVTCAIVSPDTTLIFVSDGNALYRSDTRGYRDEVYFKDPEGIGIFAMHGPTERIYYMTLDGKKIKMVYATASSDTQTGTDFYVVDGTSRISWVSVDGDFVLWSENDEAESRIHYARVASASDNENNSASPGVLWNGSNDVLSVASNMAEFKSDSDSDGGSSGLKAAGIGIMIALISVGLVVAVVAIICYCGRPATWCKKEPAEEEFQIIGEMSSFSKGEEAAVITTAV